MTSKPVWHISVFSLLVLILPGAVGGYLFGRITGDAVKWLIVGILASIMVWGVIHLLYSFDLFFYHIVREEETDTGEANNGKTA